MALIVEDRVQQTGTANTTVSFTLSGSVTGFQSFAVIGNGNTTYYSAFDATGNWEVGIGTYSTTGPTLTRTTILSSSNTGSAVTFSGTVNVFVTYPSEKSVNQDASGNVVVPGTVTANSVLLTGNTGTVTSVTGTAPVVSSGGTTPAISMAAATTSVDGYLTSTDWNTFNSKGSGTVTSVGGTGTVNGITLTGTVTSSGSLTLGGTLSGVSLTTQVSGTLPIANGGTGQTTASAAFNALSPITTAGDLILGDGANSSTRLAIGGNATVLTSNGTTASWQAPAASGVTQAQAIAYSMTLGF
jgi:hypothetical protein